MNLLIIHKNFPAQFRHVAEYMGAREGNKVVFVTENPRPEWPIAGVAKAVSKPVGKTEEATHPLARSFDTAVRNGAGVFLTMRKLKEAGFVPDVMLGHGGWGHSLFARDMYPGVPYVSFFEWYYNADGAESRFDNGIKTEAERCRLHMRNSQMLFDLVGCARGICPTAWQKSQFPEIFLPKIEQIHDGINTEFFSPLGDGPMALELLDLDGVDLSGATELLTYSARGFEPYRGFPQFYEALPAILDARPGCHVVIVGEDRVCYGAKRSDGKGYKEHAVETVAVDESRVHFTGRLPYGKYRDVLRASTVHMYLTWPFVLSWSCLEAASCGCLMVVSDTSPVHEVLEHEKTAIYTDFHDSEIIAASVIDTLGRADELMPLRHAARARILESYRLPDCLGRQIQLLHDVAAEARG